MAKRKKLKNEEILKMDLNNERVSKANLELQNMRLKVELYVHSENEKIRKKAEELKNEQKRRKEYVDKVKSDLGIKTEKFSYNPDTGEIDNGD